MSAVTVLASTQNQFASLSGGMTLPQFNTVPVNSTQIVSAAGATAYTISPSQSGSIITIPLLTLQGAGTVTITLPNPVTNPGFTCKFVKTGTQLANQAINIDGGAANTFYPFRIVNVGANTLGAAGRGMSFLGGAAPPSVAGAFAEVVSDGNRYLGYIFSSVADGVGAIA
jgi:hypothetical protein